MTRGVDMLLLIFAISLAVHEGEVVPIQDLYSGNVLTLVTLPERTVWVSLEARTQRPDHKLYAFDHIDRQVYLLANETVNVDIYSRLIRTREGFAIVGRFGAVHVFDEACRLQETFSLSEIEGVPDNITILESHFKEDAVAAVTYRRMNEVGNLCLAELDLEKRTFKTVFVKQGFEDDGFWINHERIWYFLNKIHAEIVELDSAFKTKKVLVPGMDPILVVKDKKLAQMLIAQGNSPYTRLLRGGVLRHGVVSFWRYHEPGEGGPRYHQLVLEKGAFSVKTNDHLIIAESADVRLEYIQSEREYTLTPK